ncbi:MAG TPA: ATP-binding protein, partial [Chthoniobacterales bacterium]|nr:ATP-binding protein [Chthoniobacterales bacterium]
MTYDSPFVGPRPFEKEDRGRFYGRTRELEELLSLIVAHRAVLVYAQSGAGKTSLLSAGVIPRLEEQGYQVLPIARVQGVVPENVSEAAVRNIFVFHALQYWLPLLQNGRTAADLTQITLTEFLTPLVPISSGAEDEAPPPSIIIFDQFEEFFTVHPERWQERAPFFLQLTDALKALPTLKVVFVMREEYIAQLEVYSDNLPEKLRVRMRLERLRGNSALTAVVKPFQSWGLSFEEHAAEKLMAELAEIRVAEGQQFREARGEFVEPVQLQVVCQFLWENLPAEWKNGSAPGSSTPHIITDQYVD